MRMLEYKLHAPMNGHGMSTPIWVDDGGHWYNDADHTMIGWVPDTTEYYIPDSVDYKNLTELKARQVAIHGVTPYKVIGADGLPTADDMTDAQVETMVADWHATY